MGGPDAAIAGKLVMMVSGSVSLIQNTLSKGGQSDFIAFRRGADKIFVLEIPWIRTETADDARCCRGLSMNLQITMVAVSIRREGQVWIGAGICSASAVGMRMITKGAKLVVYNRTISKTKKLSKAGAIIKESAADVAIGCVSCHNMCNKCRCT